MWIVRLALRRPYTFTVMAILIVLMGVVTITRMATDIFPKIDIPVVSVIWSFPGVAPEEMEKRFVTVTERAMTTTVNDIEHIESQSYNGVVGHQGFLPRGRQSRGRRCAGHIDHPDAPAHSAARHNAASDPSIQRIECADPATRPNQQNAF